MDIPEKSFEKCALDIVGLLPITNEGNKYFLTFQDSLIKFSKAIPVGKSRDVNDCKNICHKNNNEAWNTRKDPYRSR